MRFLSELPFLSGAYHFSLAFLGALLYGFPSRRLTVIGVTGTKGKTTTCSLIAHILNSSGHKTGLATTVSFAIGEREWPNETKQTMLGRFALQKLLRQMVREGCRYAVIETSSEGILQHRHRFINYRVAVFTNLSPEHIERHGSFEKYREAKLKLFWRVAKRSDGVGIYNLDDPNVGYFLDPEIKTKYGYCYKNPECKQITNKFRISNVKLSTNKTQFRLNNEEFEVPLIGEFNTYNTAAAICVGLSQGIPPAKIRESLASVRALPGRAEVVVSRGVRVFVDYAHEPASLTAIYEAAKLFEPRRVIGVLGSQGGGRDTWKRAAMGRVAAGYCDELILTNEDPYDEDPLNIINDVEKGVREAGKAGLNLHKIVDRKEAIFKAISLAKKGDVVVITGKGGEVWMCIAGDKKIPWSDRKVVEEALGRYG